MNEEDLTGKTIEGYYVEKPIGQGKFATVYKAQTPDKKIVALKKIRIFEMNDPRLRDKCLKEVRLMQQLEHPNIVKYLDSFIVNNELIIITEWAEKGDLKKLLKTAITAEAPIEENKIWEYMNQIASALKHMHDKRIMHRDLKPANIFLSAEGELKVGDFGLGRVFSEETVEAYSKVGTPLYMSPELLVGQGYGVKSDVWSLGCIIYEMCEQRSPFRNENEKMSLMDLFNNITRGEYKPVNPRFGEELRKIIQDMIVLDPHKRCDTNLVMEACNAWREKLKNSLNIDSVIVMEDIVEKLNLLNYRTLFCTPKKLKPVSKTYFALSEAGVSKEEKFKYFIELSYWLINLIQELRKTNNKGQQVVFKPKLDDDPKKITTKLLEDLVSIDTPFGKQITPESLAQGTGDSTCFVLNELINKRLIFTNFQFLTPKINNAEAEEDDIPENYGITELDPERVFKNEIQNLNTESDEEDAFQEIKENNHGTNTTYYSNSTSATSTYTDHMYKFSKRPTSGGLKDEMTINEDGLMELDSVEWNKEVNRVTKELDELTQKLDGEDSLFIFQNAEDRVYNLEALSKYGKGIRKCTRYIGNHQWQKTIESWDNDLQKIKKGEKQLNDATVQLADDFKGLVSEKDTIYEKLVTKSQTIRDKVEKLERSNQQLKSVQETLSEKEKTMLSPDRMVEIRKGIEHLKKEMIQMDVKQEIMKSMILKYEVEGKEKASE